MPNTRAKVVALPQPLIARLLTTRGLKSVHRSATVLVVRRSCSFRSGGNLGTVRGFRNQDFGIFQVVATVTGRRLGLLSHLSDLR